MIKPGDTVRYLNDVGGGTVTRVDGKIAYVLDDGFENPVLASDLVVVMPAGHQSKSGLSANLMFDQDIFDTANKRKEEPKAQAPAPEPQELPVVETPHGDKLTLALAFEPSQTKNLDEATFAAVLVNDSNYFLDFAFMGKTEDAYEWNLIYRGTVAPNELIDLEEYSHPSLREIERVALQAVAYKRDKPYEFKPTVNILRRIDLTKFHKLHCFRPGIYFDNPVIEIQLMKDDVEPRRPIENNSADMRKAVNELQSKYRVDAGRNKKKNASNPASNPNKLLPLIEVDLHIEELVDTTRGMNNSAMMELQLDTVRKTMQENKRRKGQKIVFIHGKGDGVLRKAVLSLISKEFPTATTQDASFQEYGFGATLVTIN